MHHFVSVDHDYTTQWLSVCTSRTSFFFFVASKNAWRGTLDSKTQTKERKWVSLELLKFILGSAGEGNKTGTRKGIRNLEGYLKASKETVVSIRTRKNLLSGDLFSEKVGGRLPNKKKRQPPDRRLNHNLPRLRWSRRESM